MRDMNDGKELVLRSETAIEKRSSKPTLMRLDNGRMISSNGRFSAELAAGYIRENGRDKWLPVGELARVFAGSNTIPGKKRVRKNFSRTFNELLKGDDFLLKETGPNGRIQSVKILDVTSEVERQQANDQVQRMLRGKELSAEKCRRAIEVIGLHDAVRKENPAEESLEI